MGSDEILFDLNSSVLQEKAEFEKEKEEFKDNWNFYIYYLCQYMTSSYSSYSSSFEYEQS